MSYDDEIREEIDKNTLASLRDQEYFVALLKREIKEAVEYIWDFIGGMSNGDTLYEASKRTAEVLKKRNIKEERDG